MFILVVDDECPALNELTDKVEAVFSKAEIHSTQSAIEALEWAEKLYMNGEKLSYAFLDICMHEMDGLKLAKEIKQIFPKTDLIFCTSDSKYAYEAFKLYAKGYLLKPVMAKDIENVLDEMVLDWRKEEEERTVDVRVQTFGHFEVFVNGAVLAFKREKAKELFAFLVDRHGATVTTEQIAVTLWENGVYDRKMKNMATSVIASLRATLKEAGIEEVMVKTWNHLAINVEKIKCDAYEFEKGDSIAMNSFRGEYMTNYSWAEFSTGRYIL